MIKSSIRVSEKAGRTRTNDETSCGEGQAGVKESKLHLGVKRMEMSVVQNFEIND